MSTKIVVPIEYYPDPDVGRPISNGSIYIGVADLDPEIPGNQIQVTAVQNDGTSVPISQPINTGSGGVPLYNGSPVKLTVESDYSIKVLDSFGAEVYYQNSGATYQSAAETPYDNAASGLGATNLQDAVDQLDAVQDLPINALDVVYDNALSGLAATEVQSAIDELEAQGPDSVAAVDVSYDNSTSGLAATEVQAALDEVALSSIDSGGSSTASYTKFPDGTLICRGIAGTTTTTSSFSTGSGTTIWYGQFNHTFPIPFVGDPPQVSAGGKSLNFSNGTWEGCQSVTLTGAVMWVYSNLDTAQAYSGYVATGRWK